MTEKEFLPQVIQAKLGNASWTYGFLNCIQTPEVSKSSSHLFFGGHGTHRGSCGFCPLCTHGGHLQRNRQSRNARKCILEYYGSGKIMQHDFSKFISKYLQVTRTGTESCTSELIAMPGPGCQRQGVFVGGLDSCLEWSFLLRFSFFHHTRYGRYM